MSYDSTREAKRVIIARHRQVVIWWCLVDYYKRFDDINAKLTYWEQEHVGIIMKQLHDVDFEGTNSEEARKQILEHLWKEILEFDTDKETIVNVFWDKFNKEEIPVDYSKWDSVANDFQKDIDKIIYLISSGTREEVDNYLLDRFGIQ